MSNKNEKHIICITGADGCGKSTMVHALSKVFEGAYVANIWDVFEDAPTPLFTSKKSIDAYLGTLTPNARVLFLTHALQYSIDKAMPGNHRILLLNAYYYKYFATELALGAAPKLIQTLASQLPQPDTVFRLVLPPELVVQRKKEYTLYECGLTQQSSAEAFITFQEKANAKWSMVCDPNEIQIDAKLSVAQNVEQIIKSVENG